MKILVISSYDLDDVNQWSGTPHHIYTALRERYGDVSFCKVEPPFIYSFLSRSIRWLARKFGVSLDLHRTHFCSRLLKRIVEREIVRFKPDLLVGIASSIELAHVETDTPIVHISDATFAAMLDYNPEFSGLMRSLRKAGNEIEERILEKAKIVILSSDWAAKSAVRDYGVPQEKINIIPLGANVSGAPNIDEAYLETKYDSVCRLLFVGKNFHQKGGEIVLGAYKELMERHRDYELTIVGSKVPQKSWIDGVNVYDFLSKEDPSQAGVLSRLFSTASIFVLPTRTEAYGLVFAEAAAFATPVIATDTGGVGSVVRNGETGILLPISAGPKEFADQIEKLWTDKPRLKEMGLRGRKRYEERLSWEAWINDFDRILRQTFDSTHHR